MYEKWQNHEPRSSLKFLTDKSEQVRFLEKPGADGKSPKATLFAEGFNDALDGTAAGVFAYEGAVYFACIPNVWVLQDLDGDGKADKPEERKKLFEGFGVRVSFSGHDLNGFVLGPDGRLYGTLGDRGMNLTTPEGVHYEMPDEGCVFRFDPDGSNFEVIHTGLRNPKELSFDKFGNAFSVDNDSDQGDEPRLVYVMDGGDSGWTAEHQAMHSFHRQIGLEERPPNRWMEERMWEAENDKQPAYMLPPVANITSGPSGLTYHPGAGFLESEVGRFLICDYVGTAANCGIWSFAVEPEGAGMKLADLRRMNWGVAATDVEYSWDGKLVVTDFVTGWESHADGRVYSLEAEQPYLAEEAERAAELIAEGLDKRPVNALERLISHPDMRVRLRAQLALTRKDGGLEILAKAAKEGADTVTRLHGVWGLGVIARRGSAVLPSGPTGLPSKTERDRAFAELVALLKDDDAEVKAQAIKVIGEAGLDGSGLPLATLLADKSDRVKAFAAIAAGRLDQVGAISGIWDMVSETEDVYLRLAGASALANLCTETQLAALADHPSAGVRLAGVIALRRQQAAAAAAFLRDADVRVAREALQAINDAGIEPARFAVAALLDEPPAWLTTMDWRRLLNSAYRLGDEVNLQRVVTVVLNEKAPEAIRAEGLRLIGLWSKPHPVDQSVGRLAPLPERDAAVAQTVLASRLDSLFKLKGRLAEPAFALAKTYDLDLASISDETLRSLITDSNLPGSARSSALELYASREPAGFESLMGELAKGSDDELAIGAIERLSELNPASALEALKSATTHQSARRQQRAWNLAAEVEAAGTDALFVAALERLTSQSGVSPSALELTAAAGKRAEATVKAALKQYQDAISASSDPLAPYLGALQGGDSRRGARLFESHPSGQCMRCHSTDGGHGGSEAGPNLRGVGRRGDAKFLLESLVVPGAKIATGFGIGSATLKGGKTVSGIVLEETDDHVDFDSNGKVLRVLRSDIEQMIEPVSSMPPMGLLLKPEELRDIVAWLGTQNGQPAPKKQLPEPELVKP